VVAPVTGSVTVTVLATFSAGRGVILEVALTVRVPAPVLRFLVNVALLMVTTSCKRTGSVGGAAGSGLVTEIIALIGGVAVTPVTGKIAKNRPVALSGVKGIVPAGTGVPAIEVTSIVALGRRL
jgi:hypothetical protein